MDIFNIKLIKLIRKDVITSERSKDYSNQNENFFIESLQKSSQTLKSYTYYAGLYEQFNKLMQNIIN